MNSWNTKQVLRFLYLLIALILVETLVFHNGNIVNIIIGAGLIYYGFRQHSKWIFFTGIIFIFIAFLNLWSLRIVLLIGIAYIFYKLWNGTSAEDIMQPFRQSREVSPNGVFKNRLFSVQSTPFSSYEWEDIHIQSLYGDMTIDTTNTVLPKGTSFVSIRQSFGKVTVVLPYDIPVRVHYTTLYGEARLFQTHQTRLIHESLQMKDGYEYAIDNGPELIISIATLVGDIEVVRK